MKPEDLPEDHRKYLEMSENPKRITNTSIFAMLSEGLVKMEIALGKVETRQETLEKNIDYMGKKLDKLDEKIGNRVETLEDDFLQCRTTGVGRRAEIDERLKWQERAQKLIIALILTTLGVVLWNLGIPIPLP